MSEMLPCPFCGAEGIIWPFREHPFYVAICKDGCGCQLGDFKTREEAMRAWNTRAEQTCEMKYVKSGVLYHVWRCAGCGYEYAENVGEIEIVQNYCPNCGRRVVNNDN